MPDLFAAAASPTVKAPEPRDHRDPHICATCGAPARFGTDVNIRAGRYGQWYCRMHAPIFKKLTQVVIGGDSR